MEPYWSFKYNILLRGEDEHHVRLYQYTEKSIALISTPQFGRAFAKNFKELQGRFNPRLDINDEKQAGWIFRADNNTQTKLNNLMKDIHSGDIKPEFSGVQEPIFDEKTRNNKIVNMLTTIMNDLAPDTIEEQVVSDKDGVLTTIYYNADDTVVTKGKCIYSIHGAHKKVELYQLREE
jgi:hypothetical protein